MTTPASGDEPFAEATGEAVQTAVMSVRLVLAIADAVRRHQQRRNKAEQELPPADKAAVEAKEELKDLLPADISAALLKGADWPQLAQQLMALKQAGVDLEQLLPRVGEIAVTVREQVEANADRVAREGTGQWEKMLRETLPAGPVREAILSSPGWPDIAATMGKLDERGVDVRQILAAAHDEGLGVDQAVAKVLASGTVPTTSRDVLLSYGPLTVGLQIPGELDLSSPKRALRQLAISPEENARYMKLVAEALPGRDREVSRAFLSKQWPFVAARMAKMENEGKPLAAHLAGLAKDTSWEQGSDEQLASRLVHAANHVLLHEPGKAPAVTRPRASTAAARSSSVTAGPTKGQAARGPAEPGVAAHRQAGPSPRPGRSR
ncbi:hypothetical protein ACIGD1_34595 [Streptomyces sp. NPDC085612]|uniref:hypothetical protein n=1 Tax=Streptomyces sp. NPDC085612 TaxID=3365732 RepID=UPI0037CD6AF8